MTSFSPFKPSPRSGFSSSRTGICSERKPRQRAYRWQERGELYARQGKYQQAVADITEAIKRDPPPRAFRFHSRARAYQSLGDLTRAIADFDEAIRLDPEARSFRFYARANALRDAGQYNRALADYETALKLAPTNAWILLDRGRTYARMGRPQAASSDFDTALKLDPSNNELRRAVEVELAATAPSTVPPAPAAPPSAPPPKQAIPAPPQDQEKKEISFGSAFVVSRKGHLLTNDHVISECSLVEIGGVGTAAVVGRDSRNDLALIQVKTQSGLELEPLKVSSNIVRLGEEVIALGYPLRGVLGDGLNVTTGTVSALSGIGNNSTQLQFTAAIQPGNSGGALVDRTGAVVGVVVGKLSDLFALEGGGFVPQGVNFAIRKEIAIAFLETQGVSLEPMENAATYMTVADIAQQARKSVLPIICEHGPVIEGRALISAPVSVDHLTRLSAPSHRRDIPVAATGGAELVKQMRLGQSKDRERSSRWQRAAELLLCGGRRWRSQQDGCIGSVLRCQA